MEARLLLAKYEVEALDLHPDFKIDSPPPPQGWKAIPAFLGMPVQEESGSLAHLPLATWAIGGSVFLLGVIALLVDLEAVVADFGLVSLQAGRYGGLSLLTSFFLHGSWPHLLTSLYFLLVFGDDVEDYMGQNSYLLLLAAATVAGGALHVALNPQSNTPLMGAGAGISGLLTFYGLQYPRARIGLLLRFPIMFFRWIQLPAWLYVLLWTALQSLGALNPVEGITQVSLFAHLGGVGAGLVFWLLWRFRSAATEVQLLRTSERADTNRESA
jgi:membrane associated rhomboid family serine protease